jgi:hypothetical protein
MKQFYLNNNLIAIYNVNVYVKTYSPSSWEDNASPNLEFPATLLPLPQNDRKYIISMGLICISGNKNFHLASM